MSRIRAHVTGRRSPVLPPAVSEVTMSARTVFLARLIGLFVLVESAAMVLHKEAMLETVTGLLRDGPLLLVLGLIALAAGLAMVLSHNVWSGGALPVVVTLVGWIILLRAVMLLVLVPDAFVRLFEAIRYDELFYFYAALPLVLGLYLTWAGFRRSA
jgi:hypothetical protein